MIIDLLEISSYQNITNDNSQYLSFTLDFIEVGENSTLDIYADNLLIFSIINPIKNKTPFSLPIFNCKNINIYPKNLKCKLYNFITSKEEKEYCLNNFSVSKSKPIDGYFQKALVMMSDDRGVEFLENSLKSIKANTKLKNIQLAIVNINNSSSVSKICQENNGIEIQTIADTERIMLCKGSLYSIGNILKAENYLFVDIDTLILSDISLLLTSLEIKNKIQICNEGGEHGKKKLSEILSNNSTPYFSNIKESENLLKIINNEKIINAGIYSGKRKNILRLESKLRQLEDIGREYIDFKFHVDWREQAVFNVALSSNNDFEIISDSFNYQLLNTKNINPKNIPLEKIKILHFNGDYGKSLYPFFKSLQFTPKENFYTHKINIEDRIKFDKNFDINQILINNNFFNKSRILLIDTQNIPKFIKYDSVVKIIENYNEFETDEEIVTNNIFLRLKVNDLGKFDLILIHNSRERRNTKILLQLAENLLYQDGVIVLSGEDEFLQDRDFSFYYDEFLYEVKIGNRNSKIN